MTFESKLGNIIVTHRVGFFVKRIINNVNIGDIILPPNYLSKLTGGYTPII